MIPDKLVTAARTAGLYAYGKSVLPEMNKPGDLATIEAIADAAVAAAFAALPESEETGPPDGHPHAYGWKCALGHLAYLARTDPP